jgi:hypothetical protein
VKKGEKGIFILAPIIRRKNKDPEQNQTHESSMPLYKLRIYLTKEDIEAISLCDPRNSRFFRPRLSAHVCFLMTNALRGAGYS